MRDQGKLLRGKRWRQYCGRIYGINGNISEDPLFCDPEAENYHLQEGSPCAAFTPPNEECDLIGAFPVGCEMMGFPVDNSFQGDDFLSSTPNPFTNSAQLTYSVPGQNKTMTTLAVYNVSGRLIRSLVNTEHEPGSYTISWDGIDHAGRQVPAGVYFYHLNVNDQIESKRLLLIR